MGGIISWIAGLIIRWLESRRSADKAREAEREIGASQVRETVNAQTAKVQIGMNQAAADAPKTISETSDRLRKGEF